MAEADRPAPDRMRTRFGDLVGCRFPIMQGGMSSVATAPLVAAVSGAGALGTLGAAVFAGDEAGLAAQIDQVRSTTDAPFAVNIPLFVPDMATWLIDQVARRGVPVVETAGRSPTPFVGRLHDAGIRVVHKATRVRDVLSAARAGADAVCLLGAEAAGHTGPDQLSTLVQARLAADRLAGEAPDVPWLLGGGFGDGAGLAAALALGADGVLLGTRFLATSEAAAHPALGQRLVDTPASGTMVVMASIEDHARVLTTDRARSVADAEGNGAGARALFELYGDPVFRTVAATGDLDAGVVACGQAVGLVTDLRSAAQVVADLVTGARHAASRVSAIVEP
ncbi:MAG: NAD(P)H-dependent flavin oxidoreductase [Acidimicrobiia bacterium]